MRQPYYTMPYELDRQGMRDRFATPILSPSPNPRLPQQPVLQQNGATGNRRMSTRVPNQQIDMGSEGNIRMGGEVLGACSQGALPGVTAVGPGAAGRL